MQLKYSLRIKKTHILCHFPSPQEFDFNYMSFLYHWMILFFYWNCSPWKKVFTYSFSWSRGKKVLTSQQGNSLVPGLIIILYKLNSVSLMLTPPDWTRCLPSNQKNMWVLYKHPQQRQYSVVWWTSTLEAPSILSIITTTGLRQLSTSIPGKLGEHLHSKSLQKCHLSGYHKSLLSFSQSIEYETQCVKY